MLLDVGCRRVIIGHSERRHKLGETNAFINRKVRAALAVGLQVILCVGETLEERQANRTEAVLESQLTGSFAEINAAIMGRLVLAYEPVSAIEPRHNAAPLHAQHAPPYLRRRIHVTFREV